MRIADKTSEALQLTLWDASAAGVQPSVRVSARARRVSIRVHEDASVELVIPRGVPERRARAFFASRTEWVEEQVRRRRANARPDAPFPPEHLELAALGERWRIHRGGGSGRPRAIERPDGLLSLVGEGSRAQWRGCLIRWLKARARPAFEGLLAAVASRHGFTFSRLAVRSQRTRWGSCSTRGTISINLAMLFQRPEVLRYLMCHELAHTRHMNHSAAFWRCVEASEPGFRVLDRELAQGWRRVPRWLARPRSGEA